MPSFPIKNEAEANYRAALLLVHAALPRQRHCRDMPLLRETFLDTAPGPRAELVLLARGLFLSDRLRVLRGAVDLFPYGRGCLPGRDGLARRMPILRRGVCGRWRRPAQTVLRH